MLEEQDRQHLGFAGDVPADHQDNPEFAHGMGKAQRGGDHKTARAQRQHQRQKLIARSGPECRGGVAKALRDRHKSLPQRLHHKGQGVDHRADHQRREAEGQLPPRCQFPEPAHRRVGGEGDQQIKSQYRGRQNQRQGHQRFHQRGEGAALVGEPPRQRRAQGHQNQGAHRGQAQGQCDGLPFRRAQEHARYPKLRICALPTAPVIKRWNERANAGCRLALSTSACCSIAGCQAGGMGSP